MALSIWPAGSAAARRRVLRIHAIGLVLGSLVMALCLSLIGFAARSLAEWAARPALALGLLTALGWTLKVAVGRGLPFPRSRWQVPHHWRERFPQEFTLGVYGFLLGLGFLVEVVVPEVCLTQSHRSRS